MAVDHLVRPVGVAAVCAVAKEDIVSRRRAALLAAHIRFPLPLPLQALPWATREGAVATTLTRHALVNTPRFPVSLLVAQTRDPDCLGKQLPDHLSMLAKSFGV